MIHETRIISIGGQILGDAFRGYMGYSAGRWTVTRWSSTPAASPARPRSQDTAFEKAARGRAADTD